MDDDGIIHCINLSIEKHTIDQAKENLEVIAELACGVKRPVLVDIRDKKNDIGARKYYF